MSSTRICCTYLLMAFISVVGVAGHQIDDRAGCLGRRYFVWMVMLAFELSLCVCVDQVVCSLVVVVELASGGMTQHEWLGVFPLISSRTILSRR